jgi:hypothetical protein
VGGKLRRAWGEGSSAQDGASRLASRSIERDRRACREQRPTRPALRARIGWERPCDWPCLPCEMRGCLAKIIFRRLQACFTRLHSAWTAVVAALVKEPILTLLAGTVNCSCPCPSSAQVPQRGARQRAARSCPRRREHDTTAGYGTHWASARLHARCTTLQSPG